MKIGDKISSLRKERDVNRDDLGNIVGTSAAILGRYERKDMKPSVEIATKIAQVLNVSLDYLAGNSSLIAKDKNIMERLEGIANMPALKKQGSLM